MVIAVQSTLNVDRELPVRVLAVRNKIILAHARKLIDISIESFEMVVPPGAADIVAMVSCPSFSYFTRIGKSTSLAFCLNAFCILRSASFFAIS